MKDEILLEMMASLIQEMYDEGYGSEFRPAMQNVLVAFNNRGITQRENCDIEDAVSWMLAAKKQHPKLFLPAWVSQFRAAKRGLTKRAADATPAGFEDEEFDALLDSDIDGK